MPLRDANLQWRVAFFFVGIVCAMFNSLESISPVDNMPAPGWGVYVSSGSFQWMGRWRIYQEENKELLSIIDHLNSSTSSHSERKTTGETSDVIGMWIEITWAKAVVICLLLSVNLLFSSQITQPRVGQVYEQGEPTANGGRRIGLEDLQGQFGRTREDGRTANRGREGGIREMIARVSMPNAGGLTENRGREIGSEDLQGQFGRTRKDAAAILGVSLSTFKRKCRKNGIQRWPVSLRSCGSDPIQEFFDGEINWGTENDSIADTSETPTLRDSSIRQCSYMDFSSPSIPIESEGVGGSCERTVQVRDQSAMSIVYQTPNPLVFVEPQVALTQMASENMRSSDDGRTSLALHAQQETCFLIKAMHGNTKLLFLFLLASGIIGLKEEVSKRLKIEVDSFDVKYEDHEGDLISIACDDDLMFYLNVFKPLGNQVFKLFVISKTPN